MSKTFDVPDTVPISKVRAFLTDLGIDFTHVRQFRVGMDGVHVDSMALDEKGRVYAAPNGDIAMHSISIRLDRDA